MRNYFALESEIDETLENDEFKDLTPEEEQVVAQEAMDDAAGADKELGDAERIIEVSDALEDLAVIADGIDEATPAELALIENTGNMAVAGTDVAPEEVIPAMESYRGGKIATEGIRETARTIWESILRFLKSIWAKIEGFFYKAFGSIPKLRRSILELKKRVDETANEVLKKDKDGKTYQVGFVFNTNVLSVDHVPVKKEDDVKKGLIGLSRAIDYVFKDYMDITAKRGEVIASAIEKFAPGNADVAIHELRAKLKAIKSPALPGGTASSRFPEFETTIGAPMLGNMSLANKVFIDKKEDATALGALDRYRRAGLELITTQAKPPSDASKRVQMAPFTSKGMELLLDEMLEMMSVLEDYKRGGRAKKIAAAKAEIERASDKASKEMGKGEKDDAGQKAAVPLYRGLLNFNTCYARWVKDPAIPLLSHSLTVMRAVTALVQRSCNAYEPKDAKAPAESTKLVK